MTPMRPWLYLTLRNNVKHEVRHLLIIFINGSSETQLIQLTNGVESLLLTGTEYETKLLADTLTQAWIEDEEFEHLPKKGFAFEPLRETVALATRLGYTTVYDSRLKSTTWPKPNFTGEVPLSSWPGLTAKNGGRYLYAVDQMRLHARPSLPPGSEPLIAPTDGKEFAAFLLKHKAVLDAIGPCAEFLLGGDQDME